MKKVLVVLSGGQDSTTCLFWAHREWPGAEIHALTFNYGQKHVVEIAAAKRIVKFAGKAGIKVNHEIVDVPDILKGTSPLVNKDMPLEQYKDFNSLPGGLEKTFVPARNQFFLTVAANRAIVNGCEVIVTGVCQEDYGGYPDCRRVFIDALEDAINLGQGTELNEIQIHTPLMNLTKAASVELAVALPNCYAALAYSHTSYDGKYPPTGHDHATLLRAKGFEQAGYPDPLVLRAWSEGAMNLPDSYDMNSTKAKWARHELDFWNVFS